MARILFVLFTTSHVIKEREFLVSFWKCSCHVVASKSDLCWRTLSLQENFPFICASHDYYFLFQPCSNYPPRKSFLPGYQSLRHGLVASISKSSLLFVRHRVMGFVSFSSTRATQRGHRRATHLQRQSLTVTKWEMARVMTWSVCHLSVPFKLNFGEVAGLRGVGEGRVIFRINYFQTWKKWLVTATTCNLDFLKVLSDNSSLALPRAQTALFFF